MRQPRAGLDAMRHEHGQSLGGEPCCPVEVRCRVALCGLASCSRH